MNYKQFTKQQDINFSKMFLFAGEGEGSKENIAQANTEEQKSTSTEKEESQKSTQGDNSKHTGNIDWKKVEKVNKDIENQAEASQLEDENGKRVWSRDLFYDYVVEKAKENSNGKNVFTRQDLEKALIDDVRQRRLDANVQELQDSDFTQEQIQEYLRGWERYPNVMPDWMLRHQDVDNIPFIANPNKTARVGNHIIPRRYYVEEEKKRGNVALDEYSGYARGSSYGHHYDNYGNHTEISANKEYFKPGTIHLKDSQGKDSRKESGSHEFAHPYSLVGSNEYEDYVRETPFGELFTKDTYDNNKDRLGYVMFTPSELSRSHRQLKHSSLISGDLIPSNVNSFDAQIDRMIPYFESFKGKSNDELLQMFRENELLEPILDQYYILNHIYNGDINAYREGQRLNYETAKTHPSKSINRGEKIILASSNIMDDNVFSKMFLFTTEKEESRTGSQTGSSTESSTENKTENQTRSQPESPVVYPNNNPNVQGSDAYFDESLRKGEIAKKKNEPQQSTTSSTTSSTGTGTIKEEEPKPQYKIYKGAENGFEPISTPDQVKNYDRDEAIRGLRVNDYNFIKGLENDGYKVVTLNGKYYRQRKEKDNGETVLEPLDFTNPEYSQYDGRLGVEKINDKFYVAVEDQGKGNQIEGINLDRINSGLTFVDDEGHQRIFDQTSGKFVIYNPVVPNATPSNTDPFSLLRDEKYNHFFTPDSNESFEDYIKRVSPYLPNQEELSRMSIKRNELLSSLWEAGPRYSVPALPALPDSYYAHPRQASDGIPDWFYPTKEQVAQTLPYRPTTQTPNSPMEKGSRSVVDISNRNRENMKKGVEAISNVVATHNPNVFGKPNETYEEYLDRMSSIIENTAEAYHVDPVYLGQYWFNYNNNTPNSQNTSSVSSSSTGNTGFPSQTGVSTTPTKMTPEQVQNDPNIPDFLKKSAYENDVRKNLLKNPSVQKDVFDVFQNRNKDEESKNKWDTYVSLMTGVDTRNKDEFEQKKKYIEDNMVVRSAEIEGLQKTALYFKDQYEQSRQRIINDSRLSEDQKKAAIQKLENDIGKTEADAIDFAQNTAKNLTKAMLPGKNEDLSTWWGRLDDSQKTGLIAGGGLGLLTFLMMMGKDEKDATDWILGLGLPVLFVGAGSYLGSASKADPTKFDPNRYKAYKKQHGVQ